ncbi:hypothetical protein RI367_002308 [Sorochytrium milnesiophthora]
MLNGHPQQQQQHATTLARSHDGCGELLRSQRVSLKGTLAGLQQSLQQLQRQVKLSTDTLSARVEQVADLSTRTDAALGSLSSHVGAFATELARNDTLCLRAATRQRLHADATAKAAAVDAHVHARRMESAETGQHEQELARLTAALVQARLKRKQVQSAQAQHRASIACLRGEISNDQRVQQLSTLPAGDLRHLVKQKTDEAERLRAIVKDKWRQRLQPAVEACTRRQTALPVVYSALAARSLQYRLMRRVCAQMADDCLEYAARAHCLCTILRLERQMLQRQRALAHEQHLRLSQHRDAVAVFVSGIRALRPAHASDVDDADPLLTTVAFLLSWELPHDSAQIAALLAALYSSSHPTSALTYHRAPTSRSEICQALAMLRDRASSGTQSLHASATELANLVQTVRPLCDTVQGHLPRPVVDRQARPSSTVVPQGWNMYGPSIDLHAQCTELLRRTHQSAALVKHASEVVALLQNQDTEAAGQTQRSHLLRRDHTGTLWKREVAWRFLHQPDILPEYIADLLLKEKVWHGV